jgi:hypothetical protein
MGVVWLALTPVAVWLGYFSWRLIRRRRYWDADRVAERRRRAALDRRVDLGSGQVVQQGIPGAPGALNG